MPDGAIDWARRSTAPQRDWPALAPGGPGAAAIYRRHHRAAAGGDADAWQPHRRGRHQQRVEPGVGRERSAPGDRVMCVLPLFHIFALTSVLLRVFDNGGGNAAAAALRRGCGAGRHRTGRGALTSPACRRCGSRLSTIPARHARDLSSLRVCSSGGAALPIEVAAAVHRADRAAARRRLGHDGDLAGRHQPPAGPETGARRDRRAAAGHRNGASWRSTIRAACCRRARWARCASAARTSPRAIGTGRRRTRPPSSTAGS